MVAAPEPSDAPLPDADVAAPPEPVTFGRYYYGHDCGEPYARNERWLSFFRDIAQRINADLAPSSVLDAGCALGMLVESLRELGVDAYGFDVSEYAVENAHESIREHTWQATLAEPVKDHYDLVVCIEVIEHMPGDEAETAVANLCAAADRVLFSSSPTDFAEATHLNVQPPEAWAALFAKNGFFRNLDFDASFLTPWAVLFERAHRTVPETVRHYDRAVARLQQEVHEVRANILNLQEQLERAGGERGGKDLDAMRQELLSARDAVIGADVRLGAALGRAKAAEAELAGAKDAVARLDEILNSRTYRLFEPYHRLRARRHRKA